MRILRILAVVISSAVIVAGSVLALTSRGENDAPVITCRPADLLEPELEKYRAEAAHLAKSDEDVLLIALFPQVAPKFLEGKYAPPAPPAPAEPAVRELFVQDLSI